ncbi:CASP-like protein 4A3 [Phoenix dactylifera]|uniref:CASP-like protein n=1 Tax=Phoenix dactylifera TaxID=42345 RepID=A0A8B7CKF8_PHODC|nr:CASP-like protein 4A3 [Phoenix dactylifera]
MGSPLRSLPPQEKREEEPIGSPPPSTIRHAENPFPFPLPLPAPPEKSPLDGMKEEAMDSPLRNPIPPAPQNSPELLRSPGQVLNAAALAIANRLTRGELAVATKMAAGGGGGAGGGAGGGDHGSNATRDAERGLRGVPLSVRRAAVWRAALGLRVSAMLLCLVSFSVMAADKTQGWAGDYFDRYEEYRYCLAVNVIAFVYSAFQVVKEVHNSITKKLIMRRREGYCFDFSMDQILAYLLISASSAAASRNDVWVSRFGGDDFTHMINASVAMSFLAFIALALSSLISAYNFFSSVY